MHSRFIQSLVAVVVDCPVDSSAASFSVWASTPLPKKSGLAGTAALSVCRGMDGVMSHLLALASDPPALCVVLCCAVLCCARCVGEHCVAMALGSVVSPRGCMARLARLEHLQCRSGCLFSTDTAVAQ